MQNILCVGIGKMGLLTLHCLQNMESVAHIYAVDPKINKSSDKKITFLKNFSDLPKEAKIDAAFIMTPIKTHASVLKQVLKTDIQNIFIEKPLLTTQKEFREIAPFIRNQKIVVGYILRQSAALYDLKKMLKQYVQQGFFLRKCHVTYVKPNDLSSEHTEAWEECCHPWDLLFCYLNLRQAQKIKIKQKNFIFDASHSRIMAEKIKYELTLNHHKTDLDIYFSYLEPTRKREFIFDLRNIQNQKIKMCLLFDKVVSDQILDQISVSCDDKIVYQAEYPSHEKLKHQIYAVLRYFKTNRKSNLHIYPDSVDLQKIYDDILSRSENKKKENILSVIKNKNQKTR